MSERERRLGLNEAVFREVNERVRELHESFESPQSLDLICECGDLACSERISMPITDYEQIRADPLQFAIAPGHEDITVEVVIARQRNYDLVRKRPGEPAAIAADMDPRQV